MQLGYETRLVERPADSVQTPSPAASHDPDALVTPPRPSLADDQPVSATRVLCRRQWRNLTAQLHLEPASIAPSMIASTPQPQLTLQLSGVLRFTVDKGGRPRQSHHTGAGTLFLTGANQPDVELEWTSLSPAPLRFLHIYLNNDLLAQTAAADANFDLARLELRNSTDLDDPLLRELAYALAHELEQPESQNELYADTVARMLAMQLVRRHGTVRPHESKAHQAKLSAKCLHRLSDYVRERLHGTITLEELAAVANLSSYYFCRAFRRTVGQSPNQYVIARRMARAAHLLQRTRLTVAHIAAAVGYQSVPQFARLFKRHVGCPPGAYARRRLH